MSPEPPEPPPVRQRNATGSAYTFASDPPVRIEVGEVYEHPVLLDGWIAVEDEPEPAASETPQPKTTTPKKRATAADTEGGESR